MKNQKKTRQAKEAPKQKAHPIHIPLADIHDDNLKLELIKVRLELLETLNTFDPDTLENSHAVLGQSTRLHSILAEIVSRRHYRPKKHRKKDSQNDANASSVHIANTGQSKKPGSHRNQA